MRDLEDRVILDNIDDLVVLVKKTSHHTDNIQAYRQTLEKFNIDILV